MTIQDYLRVLREQWLVVVVAAALGLAGAGAVFVLRPAEYTAMLRMYVSAQGGDTTSAAYQGAQLSQQRVTSYVELVNSRRVTEAVVARLGLAESPDALAGRITATSALDSVLIDVAVVDHSPAQAATVADEVGRVFIDLSDELERPIAIGAPPPVVVRVVQPAAVPERPSSTGLPILLTLGLLAGLGIGTAAALARHALDRSIKSPDHLLAASGAPILGTIAFDPQVPTRPLTVHEEAQSPRAEAFRQLRTNLRFVDVDTPRKVVVVTSALSGEGKTTTIANLALAMASAGGKVLVIEADLRRPGLADLVGLERAVGLTSVLSGRVRLEQAVQPWSGGFDVLASGPLPPNPSELLGSQQMRTVLDELRSRYDTVLVDTPPLLPVTDAAAIAPAADGVILVCRFRKTTRDQLAGAVQALSAVSATVLGTVFTMVPPAGRRGYGRYETYYPADAPVGPTVAVRPASVGGTLEPLPVPVPPAVVAVAAAPPAPSPTRAPPAPSPAPPAPILAVDATDAVVAVGAPNGRAAAEPPPDPADAPNAAPGRSAHAVDAPTPVIGLPEVKLPPPRRNGSTSPPPAPSRVLQHPHNGAR